MILRFLHVRQNKLTRSHVRRPPYRHMGARQSILVIREERWNSNESRRPSRRVASLPCATCLRTRPDPHPGRRVPARSTRTTRTRAGRHARSSAASPTSGAQPRLSPDSPDGCGPRRDYCLRSWARKESISSNRVRSVPVVEVHVTGSGCRDEALGGGQPLVDRFGQRSGRGLLAHHGEHRRLDPFGMRQLGEV